MVRLRGSLYRSSSNGWAAGKRSSEAMVAETGRREQGWIEKIKGGTDAGGGGREKAGRDRIVEEEVAALEHIPPYERAPVVRGRRPGNQQMPAEVVCHRWFVLIPWRESTRPAVGVCRRIAVGESTGVCLRRRPGPVIQQTPVV